MPAILRLSLVFSLFTIVGCNKPYSEVRRGVVNTNTGERLTIMETNVPKEKFLPIYLESEIPSDFQFEFIKEISFNAVREISAPTPTRESLAETLSYEGYRNKANAMILLSIGPAPDDLKVKGFVEYKVKAKLIHKK